MIPKHIHEAGLEKAEKAFDNCDNSFTKAIEDAVAAYLAHIAESPEIEDDITLVLRNHQLPGVKTMDEAKRMFAWFVLKEEAKIVLSYFKGAES